MGLGHVPGVFRRSVVWTECQIFADMSSAFIQVMTKVGSQIGYFILYQILDGLSLFTN